MSNDEILNDLQVFEKVLKILREEIETTYIMDVVRLIAEKRSYLKDSLNTAEPD